ncbi:hypothetical protein [Streptomyces sp. NPDC059788]
MRSRLTALLAVPAGWVLLLMVTAFVVTVLGLALASAKDGES